MVFINNISNGGERVMGQWIETMSSDIAAAVDRWFEGKEQENRDWAGIVKRTILQAGIYNFLRFDYDQQGRVEVFSSAGDYGGAEAEHAGTPLSALPTREQITQELQPRLERILLQRIDRFMPTALLDYKFIISGTFRASEGRITIPVLKYVHSGKREQLLDHIHTYIQRKLMEGQYPTEKLETFFLSRHLLDRDLYPSFSVPDTLRIYELVLEKNKASKERLAEHRSHIIRALRNWVEEDFLPQYFDVQEIGFQMHYTLKAGADEWEIDSQLLDLLIYTAVMVIKHEPNYSRSTGLAYLDRAKELGSKTAARIYKEGSGSFERGDIHYKDENVECKAHDVFSTITIHMKRECAEGYFTGIEFICNLLRKGFSKSYQIKFKATDKQYLPIKGLAKSQTHAFFASALRYDSLHPQLESYARLAMSEFEWYDDTEGEKNCMPGTYAVFGLGLAGEAYFPLVADYMKVVDEEHQSVQDRFTAAFVQQYGIHPHTLPTLIQCLLHCTEAVSFKEKAQVETETNLRLVLDQASALQPYEVEHLIYTLWGGTEKLKARARKAGDSLGPLLTRLLELAGKQREI